MVALQNGLLFGAILSVVMTIFIVGSLRWNPEIWLGDYPPDIQAAHGPMSERARKQRNLVGYLVFAVIAGILIMSVVRLFTLTDGAPGFTAIFVSTFVAMQIFNVIDLLIIDWLWMVGLKPRFAILPGTEGLAGYNDYVFHARAFLKGFVGGAAVSALIASLAWGISLL